MLLLKWCCSCEPSLWNGMILCQLRHTTMLEYILELFPEDCPKGCWHRKSLWTSGLNKRGCVLHFFLRQQSDPCIYRVTHSTDHSDRLLWELDNTEEEEKRRHINISPDKEHTCNSVHSHAQRCVPRMHSNTTTACHNQDTSVALRPQSKMKQTLRPLVLVSPKITMWNVHMKHKMGIGEEVTEGCKDVCPPED